ncbi:hypothetical protein Y032_0049g1757 [Ancylostoma ceylanicum]|uniref:Uncharacterized protein n=1 Tax=Ancylostoma ceylanicum TaxID=53326 RepID=A0A016UAX7_9BILA|nr:hypothetical protein Y032_0049g1757 [Ancylostoma ceylanicum]
MVHVKTCQNQSAYRELHHGGAASRSRGGNSEESKTEPGAVRIIEITQGKGANTTQICPLLARASTRLPWVISIWRLRHQTSLISVNLQNDHFINTAN